MNATDYTGYRIVTGFLDGNLGDQAEYVDTYAECCEESIREAFPGADVEIRIQRNASGSEPSSLRTAVYTPPGHEDFEDIHAAERVDRICSQVYENFAVWAK